MKRTSKNFPNRQAAFPGPDLFPRLGDWVLHAAVSTLVLEAIKRLQPNNLRPIAPPSAGVGFHPVNLLALLVYSYAVGVFGSQDIERMMREDAHFRKTCAGEFPNWRMIQRFRRYNSEVIRQCLSETFRLAWGLSYQPTGNNLILRLNNVGKTGIEEGVPVDGQRSEQEAADRMERAMWIDQMAMDDDEF